MQLKIAVCEDNLDDCNHLTTLLHTYAEHHAIHIQITTFSSGKDFLNAQNLPLALPAQCKLFLQLRAEIMQLKLSA